MTATEALAVLAGALLVAATLPGSLELALLTLAGLLPPRRVRGSRDRSGDGEDLRLVAIVPAHDEEAGVSGSVESLAACEPVGRSFEILVVADNCRDRTAERARSAGARVLERADEAHRGKGHALAFAFERVLAEGADVLLVIDADTRVEPTITRALRRRFAAGADAVQVRYGVANAEASLRTRLLRIALFAFNVLRPRGRDRLGLSAGILGNGFALSAATARAVPYEAYSVVEDLEYHLRLVRAGRSVSFADETAVYADMPAAGRGVETQRARWEGGRLRMLREAAPALVADVCARRWRLLEPLFDLLLLPLAFHVVLLVAALAVPWEPARAWALFGLLVVAAHVLAGIAVGGGGWRDLLALAAAPAYVAWKVALAPAIARASRRGTEWVRTERREEAKSRP